MTEMTLHATPRFRDVVREQVRVVTLAFRREAFGFLAFIAIGTVVVGMDIARGKGATWFDSDEWIPVIYVAFIFSLAAWWKERPFESAFLWTLPVDRRRMAFAKVFAGWLWLMSVFGIFTAWEKALAIVSGVAHPRTMPWVAVFGATAAYLAGSAIILGLRHPLRWLLAAAGLLFLLHPLDEALRNGPYNLERLLQSSGLITAFENPETAWTFIVLGASAIALWAAISRHKENH